MYAKEIQGGISIASSPSLLSPNVSFKFGIDNEELKALGIFKVEEVQFNPLKETIIETVAYKQDGKFFNTKIQSLSINDYKKNLRNAVRVKVQSQLAAGFKYNNDVFDIDDAAQNNMNSVRLMLNDTPNAHGGIWRTKHNTDALMSDAEVITFFKAAFTYKSQTLRNKWILFSAINNAQTVEDLDAIDTDAGWP